MINEIIAHSEGNEEDFIKYGKLVRSIDDYTLSINKPKVFAEASEGNVIRAMDLSFQNLVTSMEEAGIKEPNKLTVFEFNSKLDYFEAKNKPK